jgi:hypothetical protein
MKMEQAKCSETLAHKIQTPGNYAEEVKIRLNWGCVKQLNSLFSKMNGFKDSVS